MSVRLSVRLSDLERNAIFSAPNRDRVLIFCVQIPVEKNVCRPGYKRKTCKKYRNAIFSVPN